ncbi:hypothetical protein LEP3755_42840 [Leptolyngbya sp. NIES-3755]|nr:hypothetical protein LEP3755_42840 [Leptolyngbya sp. NIES-3755]
MPRCSVCQTRYTANKTDRCPLCGWDIQPLSFVTGMIPEVSQKEAIRLEWAKQLWSKAKACQDQARQIQLQFEAISDREKTFQAQLIQQKTEFEATLKQYETTIVALQTKLDQALIDPIPEVEETPIEEPIIVEKQTFVPSERSLKSFHFETVVIHPSGREIQSKQALFYDETLYKDIALEMVAIPGGRFEMGSPATETGRDLHENPQHWVNIAPFAMSRFLITQAQWKAIAALPKIKRTLNLYPSDFEGDDLPVEQISWFDAIEFCTRLSQQTGQSYRLPSEAEWEYACRAGTITPFHFGDTIAVDLANYDANYVYRFGTTGHYRQTTTSMMSIANSFGLSDMHGNVWEWCADAWHENYQGAPTDGSVWEAEDEVTYRVLRGGAWYCLPELCRSAQRHWNQPNMTGSGIGFRVVCEMKN